MKKRSPIVVAILTFMTFGLYSIYWLVATRQEMNKRGAVIPTGWLVIVPLVNIWWLWKYGEGVEHVTNGEFQGILAFVVLWVLPPAGAAIIQDSFNKIEAAKTESVSTPVVAPQPPVESSPTEVSPTPPASTIQ